MNIYIENKLGSQPGLPGPAGSRVDPGFQNYGYNYGTVHANGAQVNYPGWQTWEIAQLLLRNRRFNKKIYRFHTKSQLYFNVTKHDVYMMSFKSWSYEDGRSVAPKLKFVAGKFGLLLFSFLFSCAMVVFLLVFCLPSLFFG
jgi:hypothetical protein